MGFSTKDYFKRFYGEKEVKAPSGFLFRIKKIALSDCGDIIGIFGKYSDGDVSKIKELQDKMTLAEIMGCARVILTKGIVSPKVVDKPVESCDSDVELSVSVLFCNFPDVNFLISEILKFSGLTKEVDNNGRRK